MTDAEKYPILRDAVKKWRDLASMDGGGFEFQTDSDLAAVYDRLETPPYIPLHWKDRLTGAKAVLAAPTMNPSGYPSVDQLASVVNTIEELLKEARAGVPSTSN